MRLTDGHERCHQPSRILTHENSHTMWMVVMDCTAGLKNLA